MPSCFDIGGGSTELMYLTVAAMAVMSWMNGCLCQLVS